MVCPTAMVRTLRICHAPQTLSAAARRNLGRPKDAARGLIVGISTPYSQHGLLRAKDRDHYCKDRSTLVVKSATTVFNPAIDEAEIECEIAADPEATRTEYMALFRYDVTSYINRAVARCDFDNEENERPRDEAGRVHSEVGSRDAPAMGSARAVTSITWRGCKPFSRLSSTLRIPADIQRKAGHPIRLASKCPLMTQRVRGLHSRRWPCRNAGENEYFSPMPGELPVWWGKPV